MIVLIDETDFQIAFIQNEAFNQSLQIKGNAVFLRKATGKP